MTIIRPTGQLYHAVRGQHEIDSVGMGAIYWTLQVTTDGEISDSE